MADVIITAVGKANLITSDMVKEGAVVIDAGYARINGKCVEILILKLLYLK